MKRSCCGRANSVACRFHRELTAAITTGEAFSLWLAGGGFKAGHVHGAKDDFGYAAVEDVVTVHDLHATLLDRLGIDHRTLTHPHEGRDASLSDAEVTHARVVTELLA